MELFYNSKIDQNTTNFVICDEDSKHITRVMRKRKGDIIKFTNGKGYGFESQIERIEKKKIHFEIKKLFKTAHSNNLHIGISLLKSPTRFEFFLEKATEIGIKEITPEKLHEKKPGEALKLAVKRMLPGGPLSKKQLTKLKLVKMKN